jgi:hypothetical protein
MTGHAVMTLHLGAAHRSEQPGWRPSDELRLTTDRDSTRPSAFRPTPAAPGALARQGSVHHARSETAELQDAQAVRKEQVLEIMRRR